MISTTSPAATGIPPSMDLEVWTHERTQRNSASVVTPTWVPNAYIASSNMTVLRFVIVFEFQFSAQENIDRVFACSYGVTMLLAHSDGLGFGRGHRNLLNP